MRQTIVVIAVIALLVYLWENLQLEIGTNDPNVNRLAGLPKLVPLKELLSPPLYSNGLAVQVKFSLK